ncbi:TPA: hypothetical protein EYP44_02445 [Candidatus Bathyarchaeota archaeon]|nr:hypothetical protein [Candidatus Bathyarchaeota archaeon]
MDQADTCKECGGRIVPDEGELVCKECGTVYERRMLSPRFVITPHVLETGVSPSRSYVAPGERPDSVGGLGSYIGYWLSDSLVDVQGRPLTPSRRGQYMRLRFLYNRRLRLTGCETDYRALCLLGHVAELLRLPRSARDRAAYLYKRLRRGRQRGPSSVALILVCLLSAIRESTMPDPPTLHEVIRAFSRIGYRIPVKRFIKACLFCDALGLKVRAQRSETYLRKVTRRVVSLIGEDLSPIDRDRWEERLLEAGLRILGRISSAERGGRDPYALAATAAYAAYKELASELKRPRLTQKVVAKATGVAEYTIREHWVKLFRRVNHQPQVQEGG